MTHGIVIIFFLISFFSIPKQQENSTMNVNRLKNMRNILMAAIAATALAANADTIRWDVKYIDINYALIIEGVDGSPGTFTINNPTTAYHSFTEACFFLSLKPPYYDWGDDLDNLLDDNFASDILSYEWSAQQSMTYDSNDPEWKKSWNVDTGEYKIDEILSGLFVGILKISDEFKNDANIEADYLWFVADIIVHSDRIEVDSASMVIHGALDNNGVSLSYAYDFDHLFIPAPEPATGILLGLGSAIVLLRRRRGSAMVKQD